MTTNCIERPPQQPQLLVDVSFLAVSQAPRAARAVVRRRLLIIAGSVLDDLEVMLSETVGNSVKHSRSAKLDARGRPGRVGVTVFRIGATIRVEVSDDGGDTVPGIIARSDDLEERGRGLRIVQALSTRWDVVLRPDRTVVWFEISLDSDGPAIPTDTGHTTQLAKELRARGLTIHYAGSVMLTIAHAHRFVRIALRTHDQDQWWHWMQRPDDTGVPPVLTPICPAAHLDQVALAITQALAPASVTPSPGTWPVGKLA